MNKKSSANKILNGIALAGGKVLSVVTAVLAAVLIIYSGYTLYDNLYIQNSAFSAGADYLKYKPEIIDDGSVPLSGDTLAALNADYRAWLTVYDTNIDYPVMQGENDLYYASHDLFKESSLTGAIYLASANSADFSDNYNLIYGHHVDNDSMFGQLDDFEEGGFFSSHRTAVLVTPDKVYDLTIFAALKTDAYDDMVYTVGDRDLAEVLTFVNDNAIQKDMAAADGADQILVMSTCAGATTNGRFIVYATMTERDTPGPTPTPIPTDQPTPTDQPAPTDNPPGPTNPANPTNPTNPTDTAAPENPTTPQLVEQEASDTGIEPSTAPETDEIEEDETPLAGLLRAFTPTGSSHGIHVWALINLIALIITIYLLIPVFSLGAKYGRNGKMKTVNENLDKLAMSELAAGAAAAAAAGTVLPDGTAPEEENKPFYAQKKFSRKMTVGVVLEIVVCVIAVIAFILTENMRLPMVLIDRWTPLMLLLLLGVWLLDVFLVRYRKKEEEEEENKDSDGTGSSGPA